MTIQFIVNIVTFLYLPYKFFSPIYIFGTYPSSSAINEENFDLDMNRRVRTATAA